jgi:predicted metalloenzyme YecM
MMKLQLGSYQFGEPTNLGTSGNHHTQFAFSHQQQNVSSYLSTLIRSTNLSHISLRISTSQLLKMGNSLEMGGSKNIGGKNYW